MLLRSENKSTFAMVKAQKIGIIILTILLITPAFLAVYTIPGSFVRGSDSGRSIGNESKPRGIRSIDYDMNLSNPGLHQAMTIFGRREIDINEIPPETQIINTMAMGDIDGDGFDDLVIGASEENIFPKNDCGAVFIIYGVPNPQQFYDLAAHINLTIVGANTGDEFGSSIAIADINNDTFNDIIVGTVKIDRVQVFFGGPYIKSLSSLWDLSVVGANLTIIGVPTDSFGSSIATGDLNNDNIEDIIIGAPNSLGFNDAKPACGEIYVIEGGYNLTVSNILDFSQPSPPTNVNFTIVYGVDINDNFGSNLISGGDFNNDGFIDIAVSSPGSFGFGNMLGSNAGEVCVLYWADNITTQDWDLGNPMTSANFTVYGNKTLDYFGLSSLKFGDVNNDNIDDLLIGVPDTEEFGGGSDTGAVYILYGSPDYRPMPYQWDLNKWIMSPANLTITFPNSNDFSGTWVDAFDWNNDNIDDIIITAPGCESPGDVLANVGKVAIINGSNFLPQRIDIGVQTSPGFVVLGADENDQMGSVVASGDMDNDGTIDMAIFAKGADGLNNNRTDSGEIYIIPGALTLAPRIRSLALKNGDGMFNNTCYTNLTDYKFQLNITAPLGWNDLADATITLDPQGLGLKYRWQKAGNIFYEVYDPAEYAVINSGPLNATHDIFNWTFSFNIMFNWSCPYNLNLLPVTVELFNSHGYYTNRHFQNIFRIESRVNFTGNLKVLEDDKNILDDNAWVLGDTKLRWTNLTVVYENSTDVYPPLGEYEVILWNDTRSWVITSTPGTQINYTTRTDINSLALDSYSINITGIPVDNDLSNISFHLKIDAENISFTDPEPAADLWHTQVPISCGITATDLGGNLVDASTIQYKFSENNGFSWSAWTNAGETTDDTEIEISKQFSFPDGNDNLIQWRGNDTLGNGYELSDQYLVKVDTTNVSFSKPTPEPDETMNTLEVRFSIKISDNTSGINSSTIEYSYSLDDGQTWSSWVNVGLTGTEQKVEVNATMNFTLGNKNLIKWRALDEAGNGPTESEVQRINIFIATKDLKAFLVRPINGSEVGNATPKLVWNCNDNSSDIVFDLFFNKTRSIVQNLKTPYKAGIKDKFYIIPETLQDGEIYYWTVLPRNISGKEGINVNGIWSFKIDLNITPLPEDVPVLTLVYPTKGQEVTTLTPLFKWDMSYINPSGIVYDLNLGTSKNDLNLKETNLNVKELIWSTPLQNHTTYYWNISVHGGDLSRTYYSLTWEFTTNVKPIEDTYDFRLTTDKTAITIYQGKEEAITITVKNLKEPQGTVDLTIETSATLDVTNFRFTPKSVDLDGFESESVLLTISIPEITLKGDYQFSVKGTMETEKGDVVKTLDFQLTVKGEDERPPEDNGTKDEPVDNTTTILIIVVIVIVVVLILVFLLLRRKKEEPTEEFPGPVEEPVMPEDMAMEPMAMEDGMEMQVEPGLEPGFEQEPLPGMEEPPMEQEPIPSEEVPAVVDEPVPEQEPAPIAAAAPEQAPGPEQVPMTAEPEPEPDMSSDLPKDAYQQQQVPAPEPAQTTEEVKPAEKPKDDESQ